MNENKVYRGIWFLPLSDDEKIPGLLRYIPTEGLSLELFGDFKSIRDQTNFQQLLKMDFIHGEASNGTGITLFKCKQSNYSTNFGEYVETKFKIQYAFIGVLIEEEKDLIFNSISTNFQHLDQWYNLSGLIFERKKYGYDSVFGYSHPPNVNLKLNKLIDLKLCIVSHTNSSANPKEKLKLGETTYIELSSKKFIKIRTWLFHNYHLQNFISFASLFSSFPKEIVLKRDDCYHDVNGRKHEVPITLLYKHDFYPKNPSEKITDELLFSYKDVKENISSILLKWFKSFKTWKPVFDTLFGTFYNENMYLEDNFLNIAHAAEVFHARKTGKYQNYYLRNRILDLYTNYATSELKTVLKNKNSFANQVVNSRNYYTHYNPKKRGKALKGIRLYYLKEKLLIQMICCLLKEFYFSDESIDAILRRNQRVKLLIKKALSR